MMEEAALKFLNKAKQNKVEQLNIILQRSKPYDTRGRYQTEEEAKVVDSMTISFLEKHHMSYHVVSGPEEDRVSKIMELLKNESL